MRRKRMRSKNHKKYKIGKIKKYKIGKIKKNIMGKALSFFLFNLKKGIGSMVYVK
jgi:hypothetical protein